MRKEVVNNAANCESLASRSHFPSSTAPRYPQHVVPVARFGSDPGRQGLGWPYSGSQFVAILTTPLLPRAVGRPAGARRPAQRRETPTSTREQAEAVTAPYATSTPRVSASVPAANMPNPSEANTTDRM